MVNYFKGSFVGVLFNRFLVGAVKLKTLFSKTAFGIAGSIIALATFVAVYSSSLNADEPPIGNSVAVASDKTPEDRLENLLAEMGYTDVDVNACVLQFRRDLPNQCPTDKSLSYWRSIDLRNLDMEGIGNVESEENNGKTLYRFVVPPTSDYYLRYGGVIGFPREAKRAYPTTGWPFYFDETTPEIREDFYQKFPRTNDVNWWISDTCFGESPYFELDVQMSYGNWSMLSKFRSALIDYDKSNSCNLERLSKGS